VADHRQSSSSLIQPILDSVADGVFTIDLSWKITSFNRAAERITGTPRRRAIGQKCFDVFRANICQSTCAMKRTLDTGREAIDVPVDVLNRRGEVLPISISTAVLRSARGRIIGGVETFRDLSCFEDIRRQLTQKFVTSDIVSKNPAVLKLLGILPAIAESASTVLIEGPSGSGKELVARALHTLGLRSARPLVAVNCSALPETLLESELFGYMKGAFTDARQNKPGRVARAEGGTLFLDEIGDIAPALQAKLLRFIQEKEYEPLGSIKPVKANVRIIAATHQNLSRSVQQGTFRRDLYYRLNVVRLTLPGLNARREDIPLLVEHFIKRFNILLNKRIRSVSPEAMSVFMTHDFPGNIRELENAIERAVILCTRPIIGIEHLPEDMLQPVVASAPARAYSKQPLQAAQARAIREMLDRHNGSRRRTAEALGISAVTLWRKMKAFGL